MLLLNQVALVTKFYFFFAAAFFAGAFLAAFLVAFFMWILPNIKLCAPSIEERR